MEALLLRVRWTESHMSTLTSRDVILKPYALLRRGQNRWDGWYDVLKKDDRSPIRTFVRVPSPEGFANAELACQAAEILAEWDFDRGYGFSRPQR